MTLNFLDKINLKCKKTILILSLVSLLCTAIYVLRSLYSCGQLVDYIIDGSSYAFWEFFNIAIYSLIILAPCVLLVLYVFKLHNNQKAPMFLTVIFGIVAVTPLLNVAIDVLSATCAILDYAEDIHTSLKWALKMYVDFESVIYIVLVLVTFGLLAFKTLKGLRQKTILIIATVLGVLVELLKVIDLLGYYVISNPYYLRAIQCLPENIGKILLYVALLLLVLENENHTLVSSPRKQNRILRKFFPEQALGNLKKELSAGLITEEEYNSQRVEIFHQKKFSPEQALRILKKEFELGRITEEEYQAQRADIIKNL